jgi:hypothetical protein
MKDDPIYPSTITRKTYEGHSQIVERTEQMLGLTDRIKYERIFTCPNCQRRSDRMDLVEALLEEIKTLRMEASGWKEDYAILAQRGYILRCFQKLRIYLPF